MEVDVDVDVNGEAESTVVLVSTFHAAQCPTRRILFQRQPSEEHPLPDAWLMHDKCVEAHDICMALQSNCFVPYRASLVGPRPRPSSPSAVGQLRSPQSSPHRYPSPSRRRQHLHSHVFPSPLAQVASRPPVLRPAPVFGIPNEVSRGISPTG